MKKGIEKVIATITPIGSPVKLISRERFVCKEILISYGGGLGGANETLRGKIVSETTTIIVFDDIVNGQIILNKQFIVSIKDVQIVQEQYDVSMHENFRISKTDTSIIERLIAVPISCTIEYTNTRDHKIQIFFTNKYIK